MSDKHQDLVELIEEHNEIPNTHDGGSCLVKHSKIADMLKSSSSGSAKSYSKSTCNHRWQAQRRANSEADKSIYDKYDMKARRADVVANIDKLIDEYGKTGRSTVQLNKWRDKFIRPRSRSTWFRTGSGPFYNNAHHLIPDAAIIDAICTASTEAKVQNAVIKCLLKQKYNVHHWWNMMILPCLRVDGCFLSLPTHLGSHGNYNDKVKSDIVDIVKPLAEQINDKKCEVDEKDAEQAAQKLRRLSMRIHAWVKGLLSEEIKQKCQSGASVEIDTLSPPGL